jgi:DNA-binding FadR family transcriptional regulator
VQRAEIEARAEMLAAETDLDVRNTLYEALWDLIIDASDNLAYRLALNTLASGRQMVVDARRIGAELADAEAIKRVAGAVAAGDDEAALARARTLLERSAAGDAAARDEIAGPG